MSAATPDAGQLAETECSICEQTGVVWVVETLLLAEGDASKVAVCGPRCAAILAARIESTRAALGDLLARLPT